MAGRLMRPVPTLLMLLACGFAMAQSGGDPTRPAIEDKPAPSQVDQTAAPVSSGLQSIIRRKNSKPAAIINGEYIELGGRLGEAKLTRVEDGYVVMTNPAGAKEILVLTPGVEKKMNNKETAKKAVTQPRMKKSTPARSE
jgi:MSHA biogenesis protein MshK